MNKYLIIIAVAMAVFGLGLATFFYLEFDNVSKRYDKCLSENYIMLSEKSETQSQISRLQADKNKLEGDLANANSQLERARHSVAALKVILNSFMYAGDIKALTVGSKETVSVENAIENLDDNIDRMSAEKDWNDFKKSLYFNPLFGLLRGLANGIERSLQQSSGGSNDFAPKQ